MKKCIVILWISFLFLIVGHVQSKEDNKIKFVISADYPPFEYYENSEFKGLDIDIANLVAKSLGKEAVFENMRFSNILMAVNAGHVDAAISTITITEERQKNFDFSIPYHFDSIAVVFQKKAPITEKAQLQGKKIACQLGTTMEIWSNENITDAFVIAMNSNSPAIEALKIGHVDAVVMDAAQAIVFSEKSPDLHYSIIGESKDGYGIAFKKGSKLKVKIDGALRTLEKEGKIQKIRDKWLKNPKWNN